MSKNTVGKRKNGSSIVGGFRAGFLWWRVVVCGGASSLA